MTTPDDWDYATAEVGEVEAEVVSVYGVRFSAIEIARVRAAKRRSMTTTEFIQPAALDWARP